MQLIVDIRMHQIELWLNFYQSITINDEFLQHPLSTNFVNRINQLDFEWLTFCNIILANIAIKLTLHFYKFEFNRYRLVKS